MLGEGAVSRHLPLFIDEAHVFGLPDTLNGKTLVTNNGTMRLGGLISIMIQSILSGAGFGRSLLIFGTAMKVDLGEIISSCGGGLDTKGAELIKRHVGHGLIKTPEEAIKLLEISFRVPPALARHMNSVSFQQYFPLRRRFFSSMLNQWDQIFRLNRGKKKEVSPAQLAAGTEISKENAIESLVKQAKIFLDLKEHHRFPCSA